MPVRSCVVALLALMSAGCAHERPPIAYFCQAALSNENGDFRADANEVHWRYDLGGGMQASVSLPHAWRPAEDFRARGFDGAMDAPGLVIAFDRRFTRNDWMQEPPRLSAAGAIRVGDRSHGKWVSNLDMVVFTYTEWSGLLADDGDMDVVLYESPSRDVLQRGVIPRRALESLEPTLQRLSAETVAMALDPPARCTPVEEQAIVIT